MSRPTGLVFHQAGHWHAKMGERDAAEHKYSNLGIKLMIYQTHNRSDGFGFFSPDFCTVYAFKSIQADILKR